MAIRLKSLLNERFAWERNEDGSLPTLQDAMRRHAENTGVTTTSVGANSAAVNEIKRLLESAGKTKSTPMIKIQLENESTNWLNLTVEDLKKIADVIK